MKVSESVKIFLSFRKQAESACHKTQNTVTLKRIIVLIDVRFSKKLFLSCFVRLPVLLNLQVDYVTVKNVKSLIYYLTEI